MWAYESVFYQIYPLGFCGAPYENDGVLTHKILKVNEWIPHLKKLGVDAIYFSPLFESDTHGYNTRDYTKIDTRLGTNEDFKKVCEELHKEGIKVVLDGVFNHVGRGFWAFKDVLEKKYDSPYKDWFHISFEGNSNYNDGFWYEGWEGNYDLVKLNLHNPAVVEHLHNCIKGWIDEFDIDGLRLDVAYMVDRDFLAGVRSYCDSLKDEFFLEGEMIHGQYKEIMNERMCHSVTNYECYKGIYSALNSYNLFEIAHSLGRQFGNEPWCLYTGCHPVSFVDNHDVTRIATILNDRGLLPAAYAIMFGMPGIPCIYYGSEWGIEGDKAKGDQDLRPCVEEPIFNELSGIISKMADAKKKSKALNYGGFNPLQITNRQFIFEREAEDERFIIAVNIDDNEFRGNFNARAGMGYDFLSGENVDFGGGLLIPPKTCLFIKTE